MIKKSEKEEVKFEDALKGLEDIVSKLEGGDLDLEESIKLFENGVALAKSCQQKLDVAEKKIEKLMKDKDGEPVVEPMEDPTKDAPL